MKTIIVSCSLHHKSRSFILAKELAKHTGAEIVNLKDYKLPFCDGHSCYDDPEVHKISKKLKEAETIILAFPIYNYSMSAAAKNLIELTGKDVWTEKNVTFLCAAGGNMSYMSCMPFANALMLDFRIKFIPKYIYADDSCFNSERTEITSEKIIHRIEELADKIKKTSN